MWTLCKVFLNVAYISCIQRARAVCRFSLSSELSGHEKLTLLVKKSHADYKTHWILTAFSPKTGFCCLSSVADKSKKKHNHSLMQYWLQLTTSQAARNQAQDKIERRKTKKTHNHLNWNPFNSSRNCLFATQRLCGLLVYSSEYHGAVGGISWVFFSSFSDLLHWNW